MIRHSWEKSYVALITNQEDCMRLSKTKLEQAECCFLESFRATEALVKETLEKGFQTVEDEVYFFKEVKPKFAAWMIFFRLLYHNLLFEPKEELAGKIDFWKREGERLSKYVAANEDFYRYWKSGCRERDQEYFIQCEKKRELLDTTAIANILYETKEAVESSHDSKVATFLALEKYEQFVNGKLATIYSQEN